MSSLSPFVSDPVVVHAVGAALSIVLCLGAWPKLRDPLVFAGAIENYRLLPASAVPWVARLLPLIELAAGLLLLFPDTRRAGGLLALGLLALVSAAVAINLARGQHGIECGCGGLSSQPISWGLVLRNGMLMALTLVAIEDSGGRPPLWADYITTGGAILALVGLHITTDQLLANAPMALALRK